MKQKIRFLFILTLFMGLLQTPASAQSFWKSLGQGLANGLRAGAEMIQQQQQQQLRQQQLRQQQAQQQSQQQSSSGYYIDQTYAPGYSTYTPSTSSSSSSSVQPKTKHPRSCNSCVGSGNCRICSGRGYYSPGLNSGTVKCTHCRGTGKCQVCNGTGVQGYDYY